MPLRENAVSITTHQRRRKTPTEQLKHADKAAELIGQDVATS